MGRRVAARVGSVRQDFAEQDPGGGEAPSPFRAAFGRARIEALGAGAPPLHDDRSDVCRPRLEYRIERRSGKRRRDLKRWNALGRVGWELVVVTGKLAYFKREMRG